MVLKCQTFKKVSINMNAEKFYLYSTDSRALNFIHYLFNGFKYIQNGFNMYIKCHTCKCINTETFP